MRPELRQWLENEEEEIQHRAWNWHPPGSRCPHSPFISTRGSESPLSRAGHRDLTLDTGGSEEQEEEEREREIR